MPVGLNSRWTYREDFELYVWYLRINQHKGAVNRTFEWITEYVFGELSSVKLGEVIPEDSDIEYGSGSEDGLDDFDDEDIMPQCYFGCRPRTAAPVPAPNQAPIAAAPVPAPIPVQAPVPVQPPVPVPARVAPALRPSPAHSPEPAPALSLAPRSAPAHASGSALAPPPARARAPSRASSCAPSCVPSRTSSPAPASGVLGSVPTAPVSRGAEAGAAPRRVLRERPRRS